MTVISFNSVVGILVVALSTITKTYAASVTVYAVDPPAYELPSNLPVPPSYSAEVAGTTVWSAVKTLESGVTQYEVKDIRSLVVFHGATDTYTDISAPTTRTYTVEQGAVIHHEAVDPYIYTVSETATAAVGGRSRFRSGSGHKQDCKLDADKKKAACVYELLNPELTPTVVGGQTVGATITHTFATTYTGNVYPIVTLSTTGGAKGLAMSNTAIIAAAVVVFGACTGVYIV